MLHSLEHVRDHQNSLTDTTALPSCQAPQLGCSRFAAKKVYRHRAPQTWYARLLTLPYLGITGSRYKRRQAYLKGRRTFSYGRLAAGGGFCTAPPAGFTGGARTPPLTSSSAAPNNFWNGWRPLLKIVSQRFSRYRFLPAEIRDGSP